MRAYVSAVEGLCGDLLADDHPCRKVEHDCQTGLPLIGAPVGDVAS